MHTSGDFNKRYSFVIICINGFVALENPHQTKPSLHLHAWENGSDIYRYWICLCVGNVLRFPEFAYS